MRRSALILLLVGFAMTLSNFGMRLGGPGGLVQSAAAKDTDLSTSSKTGRDVTSRDAWEQSERGQELDRIIDLLQSGDGESYSRAYEAYRQKYNVPAPWEAQGERPKAARRPSRPTGAPVMTLPPEAR